MLFRKKNASILPNPETQRPAIRRSICTGEMTGGYLDADGSFHELMLLRGEREKEEFCRRAGADPAEVKIVY